MSGTTQEENEREGRRRRLTCHEEVGRRLAVRGLVAHVDEVLARLVRWAEVRHLAIVKDTDLVEEVVETLAGLVNRDDRCGPCKVGRDAECLAELESSRCTKSHVISEMPQCAIFH